MRFLALLSLCFLTVTAFGQKQWQFSWRTGTTGAWTSSVVTGQNSKVFALDANGNLAMVTNGGASALGSLTDVSLDSQQSGQLLRYNGTAWENWTANYLTSTAAGLLYQPLDSDLTALAGLTSAADTLPYFTGSGTAAVTTLTSTARTLLDDTSVATMRGTLGIGSMGTQNSSNVTITGGTISGVTFGVPSVFGGLGISAAASLYFLNGTDDLAEIYASHTSARTYTLPDADGTFLLSSSALDATKLSDGSITNAKLAGSIANNKLANSSITINGSAVSLGGSTTISVSPGGSSGDVQYNNGGSFGGVSGITLSTGALKSLSPAGGTVTSSTPLISGTQTWNASGTTFVGATWDITDTASATGSKWLRLTRNGTAFLDIQKSQFADAVIVGRRTGDSNIDMSLRMGAGEINIGMNAIGTGEGWSLSGPYTAFTVGSGYKIGFSSASAVGGGNSSPETYLHRSAASVIGVVGASSSGASIEVREMTAPAAPSSDRARIYVEDDGAGKTRLMVKFATGAAQQIAIEP